MRDAEVRSAVCSQLFDLHSGDNDTLIVQEMGLWSGAVRVDIAVINGELHGFELKSARDTLQRLPAQRRLYDLVFDRVTLVVANNHRAKALPLIPHWWGVVIAAENDDRIELETVRDGDLNPGIDSLQVARLLWREEALDCLLRHGGVKGFKSANSEKLAHAVSSRLALDLLRSEVRSALKRRTNWLGQSLGHQRKMSIGVDLDPLSASASA
jgi:hypothetical protein